MPLVGATSTGANSPLAEREYGCMTCGAKFDSSEAQRAHMRGDWHIYNLKRRMESLPPTSDVEFHEQSLPITTRTSDTEAAPSFQKSCIACEQHYTNWRAWKAHLRSRNHVSKASIGADKSPSRNALSLKEGRSSDEEEEEEEDFSPQQCLFCNVESASLESNLTHMSHAHSFFIPNAEYLIDVESLLSYLFAIVSLFHECLFCGSLKSTKFGVRDHMRGKGHCKLNLEDDVHQLKQFYDFSGNVDEQDDEKELGEEVTLALDEDELHLPSGKILGRRSHAHSPYHNHPKRPLSGSSSRQQHRLTANEFETEPIIPKESQDRRIVMRAGTSTSLIGVSEAQKRALMAVELKMEKMEARARNEYQSRVEKGGNKQKTYRVASMGKKAGGLEKRLG
ncbi:uncharacterized protein BP5553_02630 [Venustampulla echinocandica]|uniref:C2H2-type domain-containing protein n=1 Tax=Venustampulla echinocandica TaxID=2656787 RepID=A0A370TRZ3_9HELO|nr:uncharacterized protein BP5553_02630 [Venustampulla echinocandica]RDL38290.1 hypothetical protein BP5553_02630 [Venustampulla echinocandica]